LHKPGTPAVYMRRATILSFFCLAISLVSACSLITSKNSTTPTPTPRITYPGDVVLLDSNGTATLELEKGETKPGLRTADLEIMLAARTKTDGHVYQLLIVPDRETRVSSVLDIAEAVGPFYTTAMSARVTDDLNAFITWRNSKDIAAAPTSPNPLTLVAEVNDRGEIFLNREPCGSLSNPTPLRDLLASIFKNRSDNGIFRVSSNEIETTVLMKLPGTLVWRDVATIAITIRSSGSDRIGILRKEFDFGLPVEIRPGNDREVRIDR